MDSLEQEFYEIQYMEQRTADVIIGEKKWTDLIDRYYKAETLTAEMVSAMIKEIRLHHDLTITIEFLYANEFEELLAEYETVRREVA